MRRAATPLKVAMLLRRQGADLIAIDGSFGVGKSTLARALASRLQTKAVHLDDFLVKRRGAYLKNLRLMQLTKCIGRRRRLILEGICVLQALELVGRKPDALVYVKRMSSGQWADQDELVPSLPLEQHLSSLRKDLQVLSTNSGEPPSLGLAEEVIRYHASYAPQNHSTIEYLRDDA